MKALQDPEKAKGRYTTVSIPVTLYNRIKNLIKDTGFTSVSQYVTYVLREIVAAHEEEGYAEAFSEEDKQRIIEKLKRLGYL
jgi:Arc/MetJ-type ribon-helix-helix transcriptional regulator